MNLSPASYLKRKREQLGLGVRDVQTASALIAAEAGDPEYYLSAARLAQIESDESVPSVFKLVSLSAILGIEFADLLRVYGVVTPERFTPWLAVNFHKRGFYSCFISYSHVDRDFSERLNRDLRAHGVKCWFFPDDAKWGEGVWHEIGDAIGKYDRLVAVCSEASLRSEPVLREIERALLREDREHKNILFPIALDDYLFDGWVHPRKADVLSKVVGDFRNWGDAVSYAAAFARLLQTLNRQD